jgi:hypothetical protein
VSDMYNPNKAGSMQRNWMLDHDLTMIPDSLPRAGQLHGIVPVIRHSTSQSVSTAADAAKGTLSVAVPKSQNAT